MASSDEKYIEMARETYLHPAVEAALGQQKYPLAAMTIAQFRTVFETCFLPTYDDHSEAVSAYRKFSEEILRNYLENMNLDENGNRKK